VRKFHNILEFWFDLLIEPTVDTIIPPCKLRAPISNKVIIGVEASPLNKGVDNGVDNGVDSALQ
jgi:hypothetical protein